MFANASQTSANTTDISAPIASVVSMSWTWRDTTLPLMQSAYSKLAKMVETEPRFLDKYYASNSNLNLSEAGKSVAITDAFNATLAPAYRDVQSAGWSMAKMIASLEVNSLPRVDPADLAGAITRSDIRRIFLGMDTMTRTVAIKSNPSPQLAAALMEVPAELLGLSADDVASLKTAFAAESFPDNAAAIDELSDGLEVVKTALRMTVVLACDKFRMNPVQVDVLIWGGPLPEEKQL